MNKERNEKIKKIQELVSQLTKLLDELNIEKDESARLFRSFICRLPRVVLVEKKYLEKDYFFKGILSLFSDNEFYALSTESQRKLTLAFSFKKDNQAVINLGWYTGKELFRGSWSGTLIFLLEEIKKSSLFSTLNREQRQKLKEVIAIMGGKSGGG